MVYWKAIFSDREAPVKNAKVRVRLPEKLSGKVLSFKSFGVAAIDSQIDAKTFEFVAKNSIATQAGLEVKITFPLEILNLPKPQWQQSQSFVVQFIGVLLAILLGGLLTILSHFFGSSSGSNGSGGG